MKNNSIYFFQKIQKIISWIAFIFFPAMIALIVMNFNVFALVFTILAGLLFSTWIYYIHNNKIIILKDKEMIKHYLKMENILIVCMTDIKQLSNCIKMAYGNNYDSPCI